MFGMKHARALLGVVLRPIDVLDTNTWSFQIICSSILAGVRPATFVAVFSQNIDISRFLALSARNSMSVFPFP